MKKIIPIITALLILFTASLAFAGAQNEMFPIEIDANESVSGAFFIGNYETMAIYMDANWTTANLTFQASTEQNGTYYSVYGADGVEITITAAEDRVIPVDIFDGALAPLTWIKIRSGTTGTPVSQAADRTLYVILKGDK